MIVAALLFSTGGAGIKATSISAFEVAGLRSAIAGVLLLLLLPSARHGYTRRTVPPALAYAATLFLFVTGNKLTTAAATIFLQSTAPLWILLLAPLLLRERAARNDVLAMVPLLGGLVLVFAGTGTAGLKAPDPLAGNVVSTLSGVAWACTLMGLRWMGASGRASPMAPVVLGNAIVFAGCLPFMRPPGEIPAADWIALLYLGGVQVALAYVFLAAALRVLPALQVSLLVLVEPALNPVWTWLLHGERPSALAVGGGALILAATAGRAWLDSRNGEPPPG